MIKTLITSEGEKCRERERKNKTGSDDRMTKEIRDGFFEVTFKLRLESEMSMQQKDIDTS